MVIQATLLYNCVVCGNETEWDEGLGPEPMCLDCWDKACDRFNPVAEYQRRYRQEHKDEVAERNRRYRQEHKDEVAERKRAAAIC